MSKNTGNFLTLFEGIERYSADGMRLSLADAGDGVEDANFVSDMAEAGVLRLYNLLAWVREMLDAREKGHGFRQSTSNGAATFADLAFANEMNRLIEITAQNFENTLFREALKTGFFEYQDARDNYKLLCGGDSEMREDLVFRFIETQALILSPICPHICERIWQMLGKDKLIVNESWPLTDSVDQKLVLESEFLQHSAREFRLRRDAKMNPKKRDPKKPLPPPPESATIFIAKRYPPWKVAIIRMLRELYDANNKKFPENREISQYLKSRSDLLPKEQAKDAMPFVQFIREKVAAAGGAFVVGEEADFDQCAVLESARDYLMSTLLIKRLTILDTDHPSTPAETVKSCSPGAPLIFYDFEADAETIN